MHNKGTFVCCFHLAYKYTVWTWKCIFLSVEEAYNLFSWTWQTSKAQRGSFSSASLIKTYKKLFLFSYQLMSQRVGFHFPCRCFEGDKISPPFARRIKYYVIWHESQMHTGAWSGLLVLHFSAVAATISTLVCFGPHLLMLFSMRQWQRERERPVIKNSLCSQGRLKTRGMAHKAVLLNASPGSSRN